MPRKAKSKSRSVSRRSSRRSSRRPSRRRRTRTSRRPVVIPRTVTRSSFRPRIGSVVNNPDGSIVVSMKEYIRDIDTSVAYSCDAISINPGLVELSPWLSNLAANYESYDIQRMSFHLKTQSGNLVNSTNTQLGVLGLAVSYNSIDSVPASRVQFEAYAGAVSGSPASNMSLIIDPRNSKQPLGGLKYVRTGAVPSGSDERLYDTGTLFIMSTNAQAAYTASSLWVTYKIIFRKAKLQAGLLAYNNNTALYADTSSVGVSATNLFSGLASNSNNQLTLSFDNTNSFSLPDALSVGSYLCTYSVYGTGAVAQTASQLVPTITNGELLSIFANDSDATTPYLVPNNKPNSSTSNVFATSFAFKITKSPCSLYFAPIDGLGIPTSQTGVSLCLLPINGKIDSVT